MRGTIFEEPRGSPTAVAPHVGGPEQIGHDIGRRWPKQSVAGDEGNVVILACIEECLHRVVSILEGVAQAVAPFALVGQCDDLPLGARRFEGSDLALKIDGVPVISKQVR